MKNTLPEKLVDAYRVNPLLGALLILNLVTIIGFGYYLMDKDTKTAKYILGLLSDMKELRIKAIDVATECARHHR